MRKDSETVTQAPTESNALCAHCGNGVHDPAKGSGGRPPGRPVTMRGITPDLDARYHAECFRLHEAALTRTSLKAQPKALQVRKDVAPPADSLRWLCEDVLPSIRRHGKYPPPGGSAYLPERLAERGTVRAKAGAAADVVKPAAGGEGGRA